MSNNQKIGLGTVQFGTEYGISNTSGQTSQKEVKKILNTAHKYNIEVLDTASAYGTAEKVLGQHDLSDFRIVSKFIPPEENGSILRQFEQSITDLNVSSLYGYLAHRPQHLYKHQYLWAELLQLKEQKKIEKIGFSLNSTEELDKLLDDGLQPDLVQVPFNYFDRRFEKKLVKLKDAGCEVHTRSAFLQGLFFISSEELPEFFYELKETIKYLQNQVQNLPAALLNFVLQLQFIDNVIIGVENNKQLLENIKSLTNADSLPELNIEISEELITPTNWPS